MPSRMKRRRGAVPYARSTRRRKMPTKRKSFYGKNARTGGYLGIELKFLDTGASAITVTSPTDASGGEIQPEFGCTNCLSAPAQGDGESERNGRKINMRSLFAVGQFDTTPNTDSPDVRSPPNYYIAMVLDTQANATAINSEDVFTNPNDGSAVNFKPFRNLANSKRFKILAQKSITWTKLAGQATDGTNTSTAVCENEPFMLSWKGNIPITFNSGTTANVSAVTDNAVSLIAYTTQATDYTPVVTFNCRMRYVG